MKAEPTFLSEASMAKLYETGNDKEHAKEVEKAKAERPASRRSHPQVHEVALISTTPGVTA